MSSILEWRMSFRHMLTSMQAHDAEGLRERNRKIGLSLGIFLRERPGLWLTYCGGGDDPIVEVDVPGVQFAYPRVHHASSTIAFYFTEQSNPAWDKNSHFILEPDLNDPTWKPISREACASGAVRGVLVPGLGFDHSFYRMGRGSGFYEKFLQQMPILKIGVTFSEQVVEALPGDETDVCVDAILTDKEIIWNLASLDKA